MADFVGGFDDFVHIFGDFVDLTVGGFDSFESFLHLGFKPAVDGFPERFTDEEHRHFWHFAFLHKDEDFGKFI